MTSIHQMIDSGSLTAGQEAARRALESADLAPHVRREMEFEIERADRIRRDYRLTADEVFASLKSERRGIRDITRGEFDRWVSEGRFDIKTIDGEPRFVNASVPNLYFRNPEIRARKFRAPQFEWDLFLRDHSARTEAEAAASGTPFGEPRVFEMTYTLKLKGGVVPEGETVRAWMPFPQEFAVQPDVTLLSAEPAPKWINRVDYPQRSLYFEAPSAGDAETVFRASWRMEARPRHHDIDPSLVTDAPSSDPSVAAFAEEYPPHVAFTPELVALEREIAGDETNPARKARLYYDWMAKNIDYSYAREYSTLRNISAYVCENRYGDCGQIALMYITLCRIGGVPARWQSGWVIYPMLTNLHDWCEIYLEPYGWVPVDVNYAIELNDRFEPLSDEERARMMDFYFGGLDAYRLIANRDHGRPHYPPKESFRSDTVDFQRGELEAGGKNIYFPDFSFDLTVTSFPDEG